MKKLGIFLVIVIAAIWIILMAAIIYKQNTPSSFEDSVREGSLDKNPVGGSSPDQKLDNTRFVNSTSSSISSSSSGGASGSSSSGSSGGSGSSSAQDSDADSDFNCPLKQIAYSITDFKTKNLGNNLNCTFKITNLDSAASGEFELKIIILNNEEELDSDLLTYLIGPYETIYYEKTFDVSPYPDKESISCKYITLTIPKKQDCG